MRHSIRGRTRKKGNAGERDMNTKRLKTAGSALALMVALLFAGPLYSQIDDDCPDVNAEFGGCDPGQRQG